MIQVQCMQVLLYNMKHNPDWDNTRELYDQKTLLKLIEKTVLAQTEYQYCYATVYDQQCELWELNQHNLTNEQYYEQFITMVDVGEPIGITIQHRVLKYTAQERLKKV